MTYRTRAWLAAPAAVLALAALPMIDHAQTPPSARGGSAASDLSPDQRARAAAREAQFQKDVAALQADTKMTEAQKKAQYGTMLKALDKDMMALLTPAQRVEVEKQRAINEQFRASLMALQSDKTLTEAQKRDRYKTLVHTRQTALLGTLTPEQRARVEKEHQSEVTRATEANRLGLELQKSQTPAQAKQVESIAKATRTQMQDVAADKTMTDAQKAAKITDLRKQAQAKIEALLTPAQRAKYARIQALVTPTAAH